MLSLQPPSPSFCNYCISKYAVEVPVWRTLVAYNERQSIQHSSYFYCDMLLLPPRGRQHVTFVPRRPRTIITLFLTLLLGLSGHIGAPKAGKKFDKEAPQQNNFFLSASDSLQKYTAGPRKNSLWVKCTVSSSTSWLTFFP